MIEQIGNIIGAFGAKSAAKKKYELKKKQIRTEYGWARDDLLFQTQSLIGQIGGAVGASGIRHSSGSVVEVVGSEFEKHQLRNNRLLEGEKLELAGAKEERRQALKGGDLQIVLNAASMVSEGMGKPDDAGNAGKINPSDGWIDFGDGAGSQPWGSNNKAGGYYSSNYSVNPF